jgi:hypothetical protein
LKDETICRTCYWAFPEDYSHVAMQDIRRIDIIWSGEEVEEYDRLKMSDIRMSPLMSKKSLRNMSPTNDDTLHRSYAASA